MSRFWNKIIKILTSLFTELIIFSGQMPGFGVPCQRESSLLCPNLPSAKVVVI